LECGDLSPLFLCANGAHSSSVVSLLSQTRRVDKESQKAAINRRTPKAIGANCYGFRQGVKIKSAK
jgi:hypothetical protein